jgi:peptidoglycan/xylan/chitin deacetylase (PgdA/CDA1 family)
MFTGRTQPPTAHRLKRLFALTFDDGPDPEWTPLVLDALARAEAPASFFPLSPRAAAYPHLIERMRAEGHLVGLHGWAHLKHPESRREEVEADTDRALEPLGDVQWWRLPYGMAAPWSAEIAAARNLRIAGWTHDTHDWRGDDTESMLALAAPAVKADAIVLAHDGLGPGVRRPGCAQTLALIEPLVAAAREKGQEPARLDALGAVSPARPG